MLGSRDSEIAVIFYFHFLLTYFKFFHKKIKLFTKS